PADASGQGLAEDSLAGRIDGAVQYILVESSEEAVVRAASARLKILRRAGDQGAGLLGGAAHVQESSEAGQADRIGGPVQLSREQRLHLVGVVLGAALDGQGDLVAGDGTGV